MGVLNLRSAGKADEPARLDIPELKSLPSYQEKLEPWRRANSRRDALEIRIKRAKEQRDKIFRPAPLGERAAALLHGETIESGPKEDLSALNEEYQVVAAAIGIGKGEIDEVISLESLKVCEKVSPKHQARVKELAICAIAFYEAQVALQDLSRQIVAKGYQLTGAITQFPRLAATLGSPRDINTPLGCFLRDLRSRGLEV